MVSFVLRCLRPRAEATYVVCIAVLRGVALLRGVTAIFTSFRCERACWRFVANVPRGHASAFWFAMLVLRCPANENALR